MHSSKEPPRRMVWLKARGQLGSPRSGVEAKLQSLRPAPRCPEALAGGNRPRGGSAGDPVGGGPRRTLRLLGARPQGNNPCRALRRQASTARRARPTRYILQATIGCSWNHCTYCDMYRDKRFRVRALAESLATSRAAGATLGARGREGVRRRRRRAGAWTLAHWEPILGRRAAGFPRLRRVSCYATATNLLDKTAAELRRAARASAWRCSTSGPESGDDATLRAHRQGQHRRRARRGRAPRARRRASSCRRSSCSARAESSAARSTPRPRRAWRPRWIPSFRLGADADGGARHAASPGWPSAAEFALPTVEQMLGELSMFVALRRGPPTPCFAPTTPRTTCRSAAPSHVTASESSRPSTARSRGTSRSVPSGLAAYESRGREPASSPRAAWQLRSRRGAAAAARLPLRSARHCPRRLRPHP